MGQHMETQRKESNRIMSQQISAGTRLQQLCDYLRQAVSHYNWFGFYLAVPGKKELVLGPFSGEPTEHLRIPFGRGICGQAADRKETFVVQDVNSQSNYLSCSIHVKAEIVVPVFHQGEIVGEIDIDSHVSSPFTDEDRVFLEELAELVSEPVASILA